MGAGWARIIRSPGGTTFEGGRAWYTAGGHTAESYREPLFLQHLLGGIQYAAGQVAGRFRSVRSMGETLQPTDPVTEPRGLRGQVLLFTGEGKGKTTAAFGVVLRAVGRGWKVSMIQFTKMGEWPKGEPLGEISRGGPAGARLRGDLDRASGSSTSSAIRSPSRSTATPRRRGWSWPARRSSPARLSW